MSKQYTPWIGSPEQKLEQAQDLVLLYHRSKSEGKSPSFKPLLSVAEKIVVNLLKQDTLTSELTEQANALLSTIKAALTTKKLQ